MSKAVKSSMVPAMSTSEIETAVSVVTLPTSLQGIETWSGSRDIGGNVSAHLASFNGKGETIAACQLFADYWFGAESRANILKGITNSFKRRAFEQATENTLRVKRDLQAADLLDFLRGYVRSALAMKKVKAPALEDKADKPDQADKPEQASGTEQADKQEQASGKDTALALANKRIAELEAALQAAQETICAIKVAKTIKDVRTLLSA